MFCTGEYVRTKTGEIYKVDNLEDYDFMRDKFYNNIVKHSSNIIDLIECGDYVNGYKVLEIMEDMKTGKIHLEMPMDYTNKELGDCTIYSKDIKTIVTKEQFESVKFKVEE